MTSFLNQNSPATPRPANVAPEPTQFDPWLIWVTFRRCWPWAVPIGTVLASIAAFAVMQTFAPRFSASHLLEANQDYVVFKGVMPTVADLARTEKQLFFNPIVIDPVLSDPRLRFAPSLSDASKAEMNLRKNLSITGGGTHARMIVTYKDADPDSAAAVCNAIVESYLRQRDSFDNQRVSNLERWLEPEISKWEQEVEDRRLKVEQLYKTTSGFAPGERLAVAENQSKMSLVTELRGQIADLEVQIAVLDALGTMDESGSAIPMHTSEFTPPEIIVQRKVASERDIERAVNADPKVQRAVASHARYESIVVRMEDAGLVPIRRDYYEEMKGKRDLAEAQIESIKKETRPRIVAMFDRLSDEDLERQKLAAKSQIAAAEREFKAQQQHAQLELAAQHSELLSAEKRKRDTLVVELDILKEQHKAERERLEKYGGDSAKLQFAQAELTVAEDVMKKLLDRIAAIRTERRQDGAVRSLAVAIAPKMPDEAVPYKQLVAATGFAFVIPFLLGGLWEMKVKRVTDSSSVDKSNELAPIVGELAKLPANNTGRGRRVFEESVDTLRANLFMSMDTKNTRSIAVASSMSGEGKSSVASQLALSIAKATGETVLLVDCDLRCPDQHDIFGLEMGAGLASVLAEEATLDQVIDTSLGDLIHVVTSGRLKCSPHRLICPAAMQNFVNKALESYRFVVLDTAPVLSAGETLAVASAVDTTLLCVMRDVSRMDNVTRSMRRLEAAGANIGGTVFSGVSARQYAYRYGDYRYAMGGESIA